MPSPPTTTCPLCLLFPTPVSHLSVSLVSACLDLALDISAQAGWLSSVSFCLSQCRPLEPPSHNCSLGPFPLFSLFLPFSLLPLWLPFSLSFLFSVILCPSLSWLLHLFVSLLLPIGPSSVPSPVSFSVSLAPALMVLPLASIFIPLTHPLCPLLCLSVSPPPDSPQVPAPGPN